MSEYSKNDPSAIVTVKVKGSDVEGWVKYYEWVRPNIKSLHFHSSALWPIVMIARASLVKLEVLPF